MSSCATSESWECRERIKRDPKDTAAALRILKSHVIGFTQAETFRMEQSPTAAQPGHDPIIAGYGSTMKIRSETRDDIAAIRQITEDAFAAAEHNSGTEWAIVDELRDTETLTLSLVAEEDGEIIGHLAFSPVSIGGQEIDWFGLGPISVRPDRQGKGIGAALIREGLARLRAQGANGCVVLGDPNYYLRFGFDHDTELNFEGAPPEYLMCQTYQGHAPKGIVVYQPAFYKEQA